MAQRLCNRRPKKFLGAVIGAATGLAGSIIGGIEQNNAAKRQVKQQKYDAALQSAASLNQAYSGDSDYSKSFNDRYSLEFGNGGSIKDDIFNAKDKMLNKVRNWVDNPNSTRKRIVRNIENFVDTPGNINNLTGTLMNPFVGAAVGTYNYLSKPRRTSTGFGGGNTGGAGSESKFRGPQYQAKDSIFVQPIIADTNNFNDAFKDARRRGIDRFTFAGKEYTTEMGNNPNANAAGAARTESSIGLIGKPKLQSIKTRYSDNPIKSKNDTIYTTDPTVLLRGKTVNKYTNGGDIDIKAGGVAEPIDGNKFLLRGRLHKQGGIPMNVGKHKIEAEGGEVVEVNPDGVKIFSDQRLGESKSPANQVITNPNASDVIFAKQEQYKQRNGLTDSGKKKAFGDYLGIKRKFDSSSEEAFTKDVKGYAAKKEMGQQIGDMTATAVNIATPIVSGLFGMSAAKKLQNPARPTLYRAANLKTDYNVNPQLAEIDKNQYRADAEIDSNTISSVAGLARKQRVGVEALGQRNTLLGQKENIETELQNNAALNRQQTDNQNTAALNDYNNRLAETENNRSAIRVNSLNGMLSGLAGAGRDYQSRLDARKEKNDTLKAIVAGDSTNSTAVMMKKGAFDDNPDALDAFMNSSDPAIAAEARRRRGYTGRDYSIGTTKSTNAILYPSLTGSVSRLVKPVWQK